MKENEEIGEAEATSDNEENEIQALRQEAAELRDDFNSAESHPSVETMTADQRYNLDRLRQTADSLETVANRRARLLALAQSSTVTPTPSPSLSDAQSASDEMHEEL